MISAISCFNSPYFSFSVESFCILSCVAWTSLLQSLANKFNIKIISDKENNKQQSSLSYLVAEFNKKNILTTATKSNLEAIIELRDSFTHAPKNDIPANMSSLLQANCFNFNKVITEHYGQNRGLDDVFSIALQIASFNAYDFLEKDSKNKFEYINPIQDFENNLDDEIFESTEYRFNIAILPHSVNKKNQADFVYIVNPNSEEGKEATKTIFKSKIVLNKAEQFPHSFTNIWKELQKENYDINSRTLTTFIKNNNIQQIDSNIYSYAHKKDGKINNYTYSNSFLELLRKHFIKKEV